MGTENRELVSVRSLRAPRGRSPPRAHRGRSAQKLTSVARQLEVRRKSGEEQAQAAAEQAEKMKVRGGVGVGVGVGGAAAISGVTMRPSARAQQLRARDGHMEQFIGGYNKAEAEWLQKKEESARTVVALLEHISENLQRSEVLPRCVPAAAQAGAAPRSDPCRSKERVEDMKEELDFKDKQLGASKATSALWAGAAPREGGASVASTDAPQ